jgi:dihydropyrimidinase/allantoinase
MSLRIDNGLVYTEGTFKNMDIYIHNGKIAALGEPGTLPTATRNIDATGKHVLPGTIDTHVHIRDPGHSERETFLTGTMAAAAGGVTCILEHPISSPPQYNREILANRIAVAKPQAVVDYMFFGAAGGRFLKEISTLPEMGIAAYKTFLHQAPEGREEEFVGLTMGNDGEILAGLAEVAKTGLTIAAHCENNDIIVRNIAEMRLAGQTGGLDHARSRPPITEIETVEKMLRFGKATGAAINFVHISTPEAMELIKKAKAQGQKVYLETCPHYLLLDENTLIKYGPFAKCNPPLRSTDERDGLWRYINDGTVDFIGSDHGPFLLSEKESGLQDIFNAAAGLPGVDLRLPLMLDAALQGLLTLERAVELLAVNPAKVFGIYPQKGILAVGADADVVIADLTTPTVVARSKSYSKAKDIARVYEGKTLQATLNATICRGKIVMEDGRVDPALAGWGRFTRPLNK